MIVKRGGFPNALLDSVRVRCGGAYVMAVWSQNFQRRCRYNMSARGFNGGSSAIFPIDTTIFEPAHCKHRFHGNILPPRSFMIPRPS